MAETGKARPSQPQYDKKFEDEFEKLYKKDIDKFVDGSDFDNMSMAGFSELSKNTFKSARQNSRMRGLEKVYLQRLEFANPLLNHHGDGKGGNKQGLKTKRKKVDREFQDRFYDNP